MDLQALSDKLSPQRIKDGPKARRPAAMVRFIIHTRVGPKELLGLRKANCCVIANAKETHVALQVESCRNKRLRTVYCPYSLFMYIKASFSGHPSLLFSHRSKFSKIGYAGFAVRIIQEIVFKVTRAYGETLTVERIRGEAIKALLNDITMEPQEIMAYYDIS